MDWAGSGWGPRAVSLGCLLWAASARGRRAVETTVAGYRSELSLEQREIECLAECMRLRPFVLACWSFATGRGPLNEVVDKWRLERKRLDAAAVWAMHAFAIGDAATSDPVRPRSD